MHKLKSPSGGEKILIEDDAHMDCKILRHSNVHFTIRFFRRNIFYGCTGTNIWHAVDPLLLCRRV